MGSKTLENEGQGGECESLTTPHCLRLDTDSQQMLLPALLSPMPLVENRVEPICPAMAMVPSGMTMAVTTATATMPPVLLPCR